MQHFAKVLRKPVQLPFRQSEVGQSDTPPLAYVSLNRPLLSQFAECHSALLPKPKKGTPEPNASHVPFFAVEKRLFFVGGRLLGNGGFVRFLALGFFLIHLALRQALFHRLANNAHNQGY